MIFGKYVELSGLVFSGELIQQMIDRSKPIVRSNAYIDEEAAAQSVRLLARSQGWTTDFFTGIDIARKTDFTVITTIDTRVMPAKLVYWRRIRQVPWDSIYAEIGRARMLWGPNILMDSTGMAGDVVLSALASQVYCPHHHRVNLITSPTCRNEKGRALEGCSTRDYLPLDCVVGYDFKESTKYQLVEHLRKTLSVGYTPTDTLQPFGHLRMPPIPPVEEEMAFYAWDDKKLSTDCVFSLALAAWLGLEDPVAAPWVGSIYGD